MGQQLLYRSSSKQLLIVCSTLKDFGYDDNQGQLLRGSKEYLECAYRMGGFAWTKQFQFIFRGVRSVEPYNKHQETQVFPSVTR
jgi:hypothetical protein